MSSLIANALTDSGRVLGYSGTGKRKVRRTHTVRRPVRLLVAHMGGLRRHRVHHRRRRATFL